MLDNKEIDENEILIYNELPKTKKIKNYNLYFLIVFSLLSFIFNLIIFIIILDIKNNVDETINSVENKLNPIFDNNFEENFTKLNKVINYLCDQYNIC